ncbi:hypothetical protein B7H27_10250 [Stenotrophomonas maltophilia]|nr:hypothetical protein B7H27_10250 [Stenotrophomonas maltophilia]
MVPAYELERARQTGRWMRDAHKDRNSVPFYAMGEDGLALRRAWLAGWDERDEQIRRKRG